MPSIHGDNFGSELYEGKNVLFVYDGKKCKHAPRPQLAYIAICGTLMMGLVYSTAFISAVVTGAVPNPLLTVPLVRCQC
ncbi:MAG: hypothetical protein ACRC2T_08670 [Thermoguttaceae bacterium]